MKPLPGAKEIMDEEFSEVEGTEARDVNEPRILSDGFQNAPWVEKLEGSRGRGVGARVWRVRRDLGRNGDGGD